MMDDRILCAICFDSEPNHLTSMSISSNEEIFSSFIMAEMLLSKFDLIMVDR